MVLEIFVVWRLFFDCNWVFYCSIEFLSLFLWYKFVVLPRVMYNNLYKLIFMTMSQNLFLIIIIIFILIFHLLYHLIYLFIIYLMVIHNQYTLLFIIHYFLHQMITSNKNQLLSIISNKNFQFQLLSYQIIFIFHYLLKIHFC